ncbi:MAG: serine/threonine-protein phosphatase [Bdellovibrionales bacterium]|nr:serine/threonine-protein phosphatase [Bdellovibrionales bacterium]
MSKAYGLSHVGNKRKKNQDSYLIDEELQIYAIADGMGGHKGGEIASATSIQALQDFLKEAYKEENFSPETYLPHAFHEANEQVFNKSQEGNKKLIGMGTTLVACMIWKDKVFFANVGDSRAYLLRDSEIWRITEDHSIINSQLKNGLVEEEQLPFLTHSNLITRSIGFFPEIQVDLFIRDLLPKENFLLCSDGLNELSEKEINNLALKYAPEALPKQCVKNVLDKEANDNITVIVVQP